MRKQETDFLIKVSEEQATLDIENNSHNSNCHRVGRGGIDERFRANCILDGKKMVEYYTDNIQEPIQMDC